MKKKKTISKINEELHSDESDDESNNDISDEPDED